MTLNPTPLLKEDGRIHMRLSAPAPKVEIEYLAWPRAEGMDRFTLVWTSDTPQGCTPLSQLEWVFAELNTQTLLPEVKRKLSVGDRVVLRYLTQRVTFECQPEGWGEVKNRYCLWHDFTERGSKAGPYESKQIGQYPDPESALRHAERLLREQGCDFPLWHTGPLGMVSWPSRVAFGSRIEPLANPVH